MLSFVGTEGYEAWLLYAYALILGNDSRQWRRPLVKNKCHDNVVQYSFTLRPHLQNLYYFLRHFKFLILMLTSL
jgi:hypothetical protein